MRFSNWEKAWNRVFANIVHIPLEKIPRRSGDKKLPVARLEESKKQLKQANNYKKVSA